MVLALVLAVGGDARAQEDQPAAPAPEEKPDADLEGAEEGEGTEEGEGAQEGTDVPAPADPGPIDTTIERFRAPVDRLTEHYLGSASRPVRFDWRKSWVTLGVTGSELIERNNFGSFRLGGVARRAFLGVMVEVAANWVFVLRTQSSEQLALTPYRQAGRPSRLELDLNVSYPIFEGVVTPLFDFIPPSQIVVSAAGGARYLFYPGVVIGERNWQRAGTWTDIGTWREVGESLATVQLLEEDRVLLEEDALGGMSVDRALVHTLVGLNLDVYYQPGFYVSGRTMLAIPALALVTGTRLGFWWEVGLAAGWAF